MLKLNNSTGGKPHPAEYFIRLALTAGVIWGGIKLFNYLSPTLITMFKNIYWLIGLGTPLAFAAFYIISNPTFVWMTVKNISRKITSFLVKLDFLSYMDRYVEILQNKKKNLDGIREKLSGKKKNLERFIEAKKDEIKKNLNLGAAAKRSGEQNQASMYGVKVAADEGTINALLPIYNRADRSLQFMDALSENWGYNIEKLAYQVDNKRKEYEIIKTTYGGLKQAESFINSNDESAKIFAMSLKALEDSITEKLGYIEQFEKDAKPILAGLRVEKQAMSDEGLAKLEEYMKDGKLMLPDYSTFGSQAGDISHSVEKTTIKNEFKF